MKNFLVLVVSVLAFAGSFTLVASAQIDQDQKIKEKGGMMIVRDKSKPVRKGIEDWYSRNVESFKAKDVAAIMALRTDDFHTVTPDGKVNTRADMEAYTKTFLGRIDHFLSQDIRIGTIDVQNDQASADVSQRTIRMQRFQDGTLHKVESAVVQRETWRKTPDGWKMCRVDHIRDGRIFVDDQPYKPKQ